MALDTEDRRVIAGLVAAGESEADAVASMELADMIVRSTLGSFQSVTQAAAVSDTIRSNAATVAILRLHDEFCNASGGIHDALDVGVKKMGTEAYEIMATKVSKAMQDFKG